ncbi:hypothetical protein GCM10007425_13380 [Lysinibacillus alkalisoli]|uniref:SAP domain-containing protein n=1 Tax=Lysinibacillus alkalisoli TaxID=1911548 RepID=A0A917LG54_9BACI|nr:hypothetical protein GCM10007425_13380 [Lysinibacillus alkalisoli]
MFCRKRGISTSGSKVEISNRIEIFIQTGEIKAVRTPSLQETRANNSLAINHILTFIQPIPL